MSNLNYLQRLCLSNEATPSEIVFAAWQVAHEEEYSANVLLAKWPDLKDAIKAAAADCLINLPAGALGFCLTADFQLALETPSLFVPRRFILELTE